MSVKLLDLEPQRRDAVLNAALKEFALRGFDKASTNVIAKEAGISKALMFHYVNSKQELFLFVYQYFSDMLDKEYFARMDFSVKDIFDRLRQSYILQINLLKKYPWIFELSRLSMATSSDEINKAIDDRAKKVHFSCDDPIFDRIDVSRFRGDLDIDQCKQLIRWSNIGFTNQVLEELRSQQAQSIDYEHIVTTIDKYFNELRKLFYLLSDEPSK